MKLTSSQDKAYTLLRKIMRLKLSGITADLETICPRMLPLLIGPSGSGKSAVVKAFCQRMRYPLYMTTCVAWIPEGAKCEPHTLERIRDFVRGQHYGVLFIDEVNKLRSSMMSNVWFISILNELLALLDTDLRLASMWSDKDIAKFSEKFLIVGAGAWHEEWKSSRQSAVSGFGGSSGGTIDPAIYEAKFLEQDVIPTELYARFSANPTFIYPPSEREIREMILASHKELEIRPPRKLPTLVQQAMASVSPVRWLETYVLNLMLDFDIDELAFREMEKRRQAESNLNEDMSPF